MIAFDCIARLGEAPVAGLYTSGEIARRDGSQGSHDQTLVVRAEG